MNNITVRTTPEVADALASNKPVLALESTIITHGMPWPTNVETALRMERIVRSNGVIPATMAILEGRPAAGLTIDEIEKLGRSGNKTAKASRRDIPILVSSGKDGATTVAGTMIIAAIAGIRVFATGGIGGVHRGAQESFDISADIDELARTDVAVICAGIKSILDIGLTLECLESRGVPVLGFGTDRMPAFYSVDSGFGVDQRLDTPEAAAAVMLAKWSLGIGGGLLIAQPVPADRGMDSRQINAAVKTAVQDAAVQGITGKGLTPYLLARVAELTDGKSLEANIALVENNVRLGARIAAAYEALRRNPEEN